MLHDAELVSVRRDGRRRLYLARREQLAPLSMPVHLLVGNHDDPDLMRAHLGAPGRPGTALQYSEQLGPLREVLEDLWRAGLEELRTLAEAEERDASA